MQKLHSTLVAALAFVSIVAGSGCATIFSGTSDSVSFNSNPSGARIFIDGIEKGTTPATVRVKRSMESKDVTLRLEGYQPRTFELEKEFNVITVLNVLAWPGFIVDALTGAMFKYDPRQYEMTMDRATAVNLEDLEQRDGKYIIPYTGQELKVTDAELGVTIVFEK